jgi:hypothetical protein
MRRVDHADGRGEAGSRTQGRSARRHQARRKAEHRERHLWCPPRIAAAASLPPPWPGHRQEDVPVPRRKGSNRLRGRPCPRTQRLHPAVPSPLGSPRSEGRSSHERDRDDPCHLTCYRPDESSGAGRIGPNPPRLANPFTTPGASWPAQLTQGSVPVPRPSASPASTPRFGGPRRRWIRATPPPGSPRDSNSPIRPRCTSSATRSPGSTSRPKTQGACTATLREAGARATSEAPLAHLAMEDHRTPRGAALTLTLWPGGEARDIGRADVHGRWVERSAP